MLAKIRSVRSPFLTRTTARPHVSDGSSGKPMRFRLIVDGMVVVLLLALGAVFYWPRGDILQSRYVYYADMYERSGHLWNQDYGHRFQRHIWEEISPFSALAARGLMAALGSRPRAVVWTLNTTILLVAVPATYLLLRCWFSSATALGVSAFGLFGRCLLGLSRGLGLVQIHLLLPASLLVLLCIPALGRRDRSRVLSVLGIVLSVALVYLLGCHETFYGLTVLAGGLAFLGARWVWSCVVARRIRRAFPWLAGSVAAGLLIGGLCMTAIWVTNPSKGERPSLKDLVTYEYFGSRIAHDVRLETDARRPSRKKVLAGTFLHGRYLTPMGRHHENTFLYPGRGFNGIVALFMLPGLVVGLVLLVHRSCLLVRGLAPAMPPRHKGMLLWLWMLVGLFAAAAVSSSDPKPTRYTYAIYAVYVLVFLGYEWIVDRLWPSPASGNARLRRWISSSVVFLVLLLVGLRVWKNYRDLETYLSHYRGQQVVSLLEPEVVSALEHSKGGGPVVVVFPTKRRWRHPAVGLLAEFEAEENPKIYFGEPESPEIAPDAKLLKVGR